MHGTPPGRLRFYFLACVLANKLILEGIDEGVRTDHQGVILSLSALERSSINKSLEIDHGLISVSYRTILNCYQTGVLLLNLLQLVLDILIGYVSLCAFNLNTLVLAQGYFRLNCNCCGVDERLTLLDLLNAISGLETISSPLSFTASP